MTPLGCPDCLLIRYEPRALRARFHARARAIAFAFPSQACVARFFCYYVFFRVASFFQNAQCVRIASVRSFARVKPTMSCYEILDDVTISLEYCSLFPSSLRYSARRGTKPALD